MRSNEARCILLLWFIIISMLLNSAFYCYFKVLDVLDEIKDRQLIENKRMCYDLFSSKYLLSRVWGNNEIFNFTRYRLMSQTIELPYNVNTNTSMNLEQVKVSLGSQFPAVHVHTEEEVKLCDEELQGLRIDFIGDSKARILFDSTVSLLSHLPITIKSEFAEHVHNLWKKRYAVMENDPAFRLRYLPAFNESSSNQNQPYMIEKYLSDILELPNEILPQIVVISFSQWETHESRSETLRSLDSIQRHMEEISASIDHLGFLFQARSVKLVWLLLDPVKDYSKDFVQTYYLEWFNEVAIRTLKHHIKQGFITLWDTGIPYAVKVIEQCNIYHRIQKTPSTIFEDVYKCQDRKHAGPFPAYVRAQMILNCLCNYKREYKHTK